MGVIDGFREWVNGNAAIATGGAVVICVAALVVVFSQATGSSRTVDTSGQQTFYYDVEAEEVFTDSADKIPPITSPAGNEAVRVYMFSCGECSEAERFVGYYEKYTEEAKQVLTGSPGESASNGSGDPEEARRIAMQEGQRISTDGESWSQGGFGPQLRGQLASKCDSPEQLRACKP